jgi:hypothetical protein
LDEVHDIVSSSFNLIGCRVGMLPRGCFAKHAVLHEQLELPVLLAQKPCGSTSLPAIARVAKRGAKR